MRFTLDKGGAVPLYRQLAAQIRSAIETGAYREGQRLPTEAELLCMTGVSKGTIKAAYEELRQIGYIRKVQGSGAYVQRPSGEELKARAAQLATGLFDELSALSGISVSGAYALFLQELETAFASSEDVSAALVICAPELLELTAKRLSGVEHLCVHPFVLGDVLSGSRLMDGAYDFLLTTQSDSVDLIRYAAAMKLRMEKMELTEGSETLSEVTKLSPETTIGVVYRTASFYGNICDSFRMLGLRNPVIAGSEQELVECFAGVELGELALVVPPDYERNSNQATLDLAMAVRAAGGTVIPFYYMMDQGSFLHLETRVQELYAIKNAAERSAV